jgi:hypothetical protein
MWEPAYVYDVLPLLVFVIETDCVLCEVWAGAEETVEHWTSMWAAVSAEYWYLRETDCKSSYLNNWWLIVNLLLAYGVF